MTDAERMDMQAQIDETVSQILAGIDAQAPDYDKAKYVFDYLASNVAYSTGAPDNQNIISVFVNGETVCQGYAAATQYLLEKQYPLPSCLHRLCISAGGYRHH